VVASTAIVSSLQRQRVFIVAWAEITYRKCGRNGPRYASDITHAEWAVIEPRMSPLSACGQGRGASVR